jgi:hypothetical protein
MAALTCTQALDEAYRCAVEKLPADTHGRLAKALALVQHGQVSARENGYWEVASQREGGYPHSVNGQCDCDWAQFHPGHHCTHQLAVLLQRKTMQLMRQSPTPLVDAPPTPAPAPLPEAPASATAKVMMHGYEVLLTVRDSDESRLLRRLEALLRDARVRPAPHKPARPQGQQWKQRQHGR